MSRIDQDRQGKGAGPLLGRSNTILVQCPAWNSKMKSHPRSKTDDNTDGTVFLRAWTETWKWGGTVPIGLVIGFALTVFEIKEGTPSILRLTRDYVFQQITHPRSVACTNVRFRT
jgi:hypothetical protein